MENALRKSRRDLLIGGLGLLTAGLSSASWSDAQQAGMRRAKKWPYGVQLWTVDAELHADIPGTLKALKRIGYSTVETAGLLGHSAKELCVLIEGAGLRCRSTHTSMADLIGGLDQLGVTVVTPRAHENRSGIVTFSVGSAEENVGLMNRLLEKKILISVRYTSNVGGVRVSCHFYNSEEDIDVLLNEVKRNLE